MMKSMTGFGKASVEDEAYRVNIEIKSVNHRFLDVQLKLPTGMSAFDLAIRKQVSQKLSRGRVELICKLEELQASSKKAKVNHELFTQVMAQLPEVSPENLINQLLLREEFIEVTNQEIATERLQDLVLSALDQALDQLVAKRAQEGEQIYQVLQQQGQEATTVLTQLVAFQDIYEKEYQERYTKKLQDYLGGVVDQDRLLTELAILLEKGDTHEEMDRLNIHLQTYAATLQKKVPIGRELDFLVQEMNREVNTIGSKTSHVTLKGYVIQLKTILEKIREQIQNVE
ncbi:YicC/YloC family endoribonuclease [uncultured Enterococcus sp.]|uniref:YicC/YloC family endoribonuclease n=1 Tax=uncultured Enterococcus sp. TaxID=167972 RepID=UPI00262D7772|nr:YicC/YloC family endoribonuclease [uncultured Enterococcus sp.]